MDNLSNYYNKNYAKYGIKFQREYPNEELVRFLSRNFSTLKKAKKKRIKILETGCGSGGNMWMLAEQGYSSFGIDLSSHAVKIANNLLKKKKLKSEIIQGNMCDIPYKNNYFHAIVDIFSSCHLTSNQGLEFLEKCYLKLRKNGIFFSYFPSKKSKMYKSKKNIFLDLNTIYNNMKSKNIYEINNFPLRFLGKNDYLKILRQKKFLVTYSEELTKTYFNGRDHFTFNVIEAKKI